MKISVNFLGLFMFLGFASGTSAFGGNCYQLSKTENSWNDRVIDLLCVDFTSQVEVSFITVNATGKRQVARFGLDLLYRARVETGEVEVNQDVYAIAQPKSLLSQFRIEFDGRVDSSGEERGTVDVFGTKYFYRTANL